MRRTFARKKKNKRHELLYTAQLKRDAMKKDNEWGFYTLPTQIDPEKRAIERLKIASEMSLKNYGTPLVVTTSGGKDSSVCVELAQRASIPFEVQHNHTTADAPETVRFVRQEFARLENLGIKCTVNYPTYKGKRTSMWGLIPQKLMPPTRMARYCCEVLKEHGGDGHFVCTGVRWGESARRAKMRGIFEKQVKDRDRSVKVQEDGGSLEELFAPCKLKAKHIVNPIIDWTTSQVWDFLRDSKVPVNPLYECGFDRVGCVGCPLAGKKRYREFNYWPAYEKLYIQTFDRMLEERRRRGKMQGNWMMGGTGQDVFRWWMEEDVLPGQMSLYDYEEG
jgi:phosphoadenosine phosphosulfate reductase